MKSNVVLILTGTITPQISTKMVITDPDTRLNEYLRAVKWYLENTPYKVVFCENSGYANFTNHLGEVDYDRFEYITFKKEKIIGGAGYGEWEILRTIKEKSAFVKDATIIMKCTGRLILLNVKNVMSQFSNLHGSCFAGNYARDFLSMGTTFFAFTPDLFDDILSIHEDILHNWVEKAIIIFVHRQFKKDPKSIVLFNRPLFVSGRSGHYGNTYDTPMWMKPIRYIRKSQRLLEWHLITKRKFRKIL